MCVRKWKRLSLFSGKLYRTFITRRISDLDEARASHVHVHVHAHPPASCMPPAGEPLSTAPRPLHLGTYVRRNKLCPFLKLFMAPPCRNRKSKAARRRRHGRMAAVFARYWAVSERRDAFHLTSEPMFLMNPMNPLNCEVFRLS